MFLFLAGIIRSRPHRHKEPWRAIALIRKWLLLAGCSHDALFGVGLLKVMAWTPTILFVSRVPSLLAISS